MSGVLRSAIAAMAFISIQPFAGRVGAQQDPPSPPRSTPPPRTAAAATPSPAPSATSPPSPSATPLQRITFNGYADAGYTAVNLTDKVRFVNGASSRIFDGANGPFFDANGGRELAPPNDFNDTLDLQNINLQVSINGRVIGGKLEESFGTDADAIASNGQSRSGTNVTQAYAQVTEGPLTLLAGKFSSLASAEVIEAPNNADYSRSYLYGEATPFTVTGLRLTYICGPKLTIVAGINNGWDDWKFAGKARTLEAALELTPSPAYALTVDTYNGNDFALDGILNATTTQDAVFTNRMLYDAVLTVHPAGRLTLIANYDNGTQSADGIDAGPLAFATARWNGVAGYATYQFNARYSLSLRKETFRDDSGFRTGIAQRLQSNTATFDITPNGHALLRLEYRLDASDEPAFAYRGFNAATGVGRNHQTSIGLESVFKFP